MKEQPDLKKWLKIIGANFHGLRIAQKKQLKTVAKAVKISVALLEEIEKGQYDMELELYAQLCFYYGVSLSDVATENKFGTGTPE
jgi:transcriptional regulator with XRE-family HTH domain